MSVYSMTGYANAQSAVEAGTERAAVSIELRSVNGRFLDLAFRLPDELRSLEPALRDLLGRGLPARQDRTAAVHLAREPTAPGPSPSPSS